MDAGSEALAWRWVDADETPPAQVDAEPLAWALKAICYAAWHNDPPRAQRAAACLASLPATGAVPALAAWCAGIAALIDGRMEDALAALSSAGAAFTARGELSHATDTRVPTTMALTLLGRHAEASASAQATANAYVALGNLTAAAKVALNQGSLALHQDAYAQCEQHYRQAQAWLAQGAGDAALQVMAGIGLADALTAQGQWSEAQAHYRQAHTRAGQHGLAVWQAVADESQALLDLARGSHAAALAGMVRARTAYAALGMPQQQAVADKQLADAYLALNLLPEALALLDEVQQRFADLAMPVEQAWAQTQRGRTLARLGLAGADLTLADAAARFAQLANATGTAAVALARAEQALQHGRSADALAHADAALAAPLGTLPADSHAYARLLQAQALLATGALDAAAAQLTTLADHGQAHGMTALLCRIAVAHMRLAQARGDTDAALRHADDAIARFEALRERLPSGDLRRAYLREHRLPYRARLAAALDAGDAAAVLALLERLRGWTLGEEIAGARDLQATSADDVAVLRARQQWLARRAEDWAVGGEVVGDRLLADLHATERQLGEALRRHQLLRGAAAADPDAMASATELARTLGPHEALLAWGVCGDEVFALLAHAGELRLHRHLARADDVHAAAQGARFQIAALAHGGDWAASHATLLRTRAQVHLARLHTLLWQPLQGALAGVRRLLLVPPALAAGVPFAALHDPGAAPHRAALGWRIALAQAPSVRAALRALAQPLATPAAAARAVLVADAANLPHTATEVAALAPLFATTQLLRGSAASPAEVTRLAQQAQVLHLACHARQRPDNPAFSALHLPGGSLSAEAVQALTLPASVVVLAACETGLPALASGDVDDDDADPQGLVRAFLVAGAARVVASLWPVDDAATAALMHTLHRARRRGLDTAAALQLAQRRVARRWPHPFHWAGFAVFGGW